MLEIQNTITLTSSLIHSERQIETISRFRRVPYLLVNGERLDVPVLSGNAIRGYLRRAIALRICNLLEIQPRTLSWRGFYLLFNGGVLEGSDWAWRIDDTERLFDLLPHLRLFGCSYRSRIIPGTMMVLFAEPACKELRDTLPHHQQHPAYDEYPDGPPSLADLLAEVPYSRRDDFSSEVPAGEKSATQMRYEFEALLPGTRLVHGFRIATSHPLALGAFRAAVAQATDWNALGGRSSIGHGRFRWTAPDVASEHGMPLEQWQQHTVERRDQIIGLLTDGEPIGGEADKQLNDDPPADTPTLNTV